MKLAVNSCTVFCESQLSVSKTSYIDFGTALKHRFTYPTFMVYVIDMPQEGKESLKTLWIISSGVQYNSTRDFQKKVRVKMYL